METYQWNHTKEKDYSKKAKKKESKENYEVLPKDKKEFQEIFEALKKQ